MKHTPALVVGNWKLNPTTITEAKVIITPIKKRLRHFGSTRVVVAPPTIFVPEVAKFIGTSELKLGAQNCYPEDRGPFTGEVSAALLAPYGVSYVIVGHSERRVLGESDDFIQKKVLALIKRKLTPIICIGEKNRDKQGNFFNLIEAQLRSLAKDLPAAQLLKTVIAYEPIWAIGTGLTATAEDVKEMQLFIVSVLTKLYDRKTAEKVVLLYGGSVKASNARELHEQGGMNGFLVGGASLSAEEFLAVIMATLPVPKKNK